MIGVFRQGPLVELGGLFVVPLLLGFDASTEVFFGGPLVNRRDGHFAHRQSIRYAALFGRRAGRLPACAQLRARPKMQSPYLY